MEREVKEPVRVAPAAQGKIDCTADHAERLLHTDFATYLLWYTPKGRLARNPRPSR